MQRRAQHDEGQREQRAGRAGERQRAPWVAIGLDQRVPRRVEQRSYQHERDDDEIHGNNSGDRAAGGSQPVIPGRLTGQRAKTDHIRRGAEVMVGTCARWGTPH